MRRLLWDISGAFGDIGVLFPLAVALIAANGFNPTALFLMAGLFYIASSWFFRVTMPVQPLKAMAAIAISTGLGFEVINAAGMVMGAILLFIALTGLSVKLGELFPVSVIRGIQLGLGLMLVRASFGLMAPEAALAVSAGVLLFACVVFIKAMPPLIPVLVLGILFSLRPGDVAFLGPVPLEPALPTPENLWTGFMVLVIPQIALTLGNAVVATENTGKILYGSRASRLNLRNIPLSMALANMVSGIVGGAPMCHGSGGLTAHRKFGASSERSGYIIGVSLVVFALLFGGSSLAIVGAFPKGILGVLLFYVGLQHSLFMKDILDNRPMVAIAVLTAVVGFVSGNLSLGFAGGIALHYGLEGVRLVRARPVRQEL
jgi:MFS superfamily sulfate permease-like transporter